MKQKYNFNKKVLEDIVKESDSFPEVTRKLGLDPNKGNTKRNVERVVKRNNIPTNHFSSVQRFEKSKDRYKKERLIELIKNNNTLKDVLLDLDLLPIETNYRTLKKYLDLYKIDYSHIKRKNKRVGKTIVDYGEENFKKIVKESFCFADVKRKLGLSLTGNNNDTLRRYIEKYGLDVSHFNPNKIRTNKLSNHNRKALSQILVEGSTYTNTTNLKERLYKEGLKERKCELCGQGEEWRGKKMSLILDHINGINNDNRIENLRIVCPNCNATLPTHCGKNKKKT